MGPEGHQRRKRKRERENSERHALEKDSSEPEFAKAGLSKLTGHPRRLPPAPGGDACGFQGEPAGGRADHPGRPWPAAAARFLCARNGRGLSPKALPFPRKHSSSGHCAQSPRAQGFPQTSKSGEFLPWF